MQILQKASKETLAREICVMNVVVVNAYRIKAWLACIFQIS